MPARICSRRQMERGRRQRRKPVNPPPPVKGGTGVFFNRHGSPNPPVPERCFFTSEPCSDPLCCWNAPGPRFFTILASLFLHFCVAARFKEQLFFLSPPQTGGGAKSSNSRGELLGSTFLLQLTRKHSLVGSHPPPKLGGVISHFLLLSLHVFLGRVHGDAEIVPEKNRESFPLSANVFWCWLRMLLLAEYRGVLK